MNKTNLDTINIVLTENAARKISQLIANEPEPANTFLRITVNGGGCSGFKYDYNFVTIKNPDDLILSFDDKALVIIDDMSKEYMKGSVIDYIETLAASNFEIKNPNSTSSCGCGNSFSV